jgi:hypothetical protein
MAPHFQPKHEEQYSIGAKCPTDEVDALQNGISEEMNLPFVYDYAAFLATQFYGNPLAPKSRAASQRRLAGHGIAVRIKTVMFVK